MKHITALFLLFTLIIPSSCGKQPVMQSSNEQGDLTFSVESARAEGDETYTRSSYTPDGRISDFTIFVFDRYGNSVSSNYYEGDANMSGRVLFVNESLHTTFDDPFNVYIIANLGDLRSSSELCSDGVPSVNKIKNYTYSFSNDYQEFDRKGFPMAGYYDGYRPGSDSRTLYAYKLVTQYNIRFVKSSGNPNTYTITGGRLCNVASKCTPFQHFKAASESDVADNGDSFSSSDILCLNSGTGASLFVLENEQGQVFPTSVNTEKARRMESFPSGSIYRKVCTYAEFYVMVKTPTANYDNVTYRYFFGDGVRDCNVHRNMYCNLTMNFDNVLVEDEGWRIEPADPVIDDDALVLSRRQLSIIKGMSNTLTVSRNEGVSYEMSYSQADAMAYGLTITKSTSGNEDTYTFSTSYTPSVPAGTTIQKVDYADIPVTFTTSDGFVRKEFTVRINKNPLLMDFSFHDGLGYADIAETVDWPSGTTFETSVTGILYGENQYCSNRLLGHYDCDIWQSNLDVYATASELSDGDAASTDFVSLDLRTEGIQTKLHDLNKSHPTDHHFAVGSTEIHYTAVGHAYMRLYYAIKIGGNVASIPITIINRGGSSGNSYRMDPDGSATYMSVRAQWVPAWYYEPSVTNNNAADGYANGYESAGNEYQVSLRNYVYIVNGVPVDYNRGYLHSLNVEGGARESYSPLLGMDLVYGLPDFVSY